MKRPRPETSRPTPSPTIPSSPTDSSKHKRDPKQSPSSQRLLLALHRRCTPPSLLASLLLATYLLYLLWQQGWSDLLDSSSSCRAHSTSQPQSRLILTASHLRSGPEGELRLRIIAHNLKLLYEEDAQPQPPHRHRPPTRSIVIFSHDDEDDPSSLLETIRRWKSGPADGLVDQVHIVPNDPVNVDVSKWMSVLDSSPPLAPLPSQTMLLNDSFLLLSPPSLWHCPSVCGLAWTAPPRDPARHFQSYLRVLSRCETDRYRRFVRASARSENVQEVIQRMEVDLSWAKNAQASFEYGGGHPDEDGVQRKLIGEGYPAIKLKKFFETEDPWGGGGGGGVSPSLDLEVYRKKNHDLNHLSDRELEEHFATFGWRENRVYSRLPLVMKGWLREELEKLPGGRGEEILGILEDYLTMLNEGIQRMGNEEKQVGR